MSVTTIGRVARFLIAGNGGYQTASEAPDRRSERGDFVMRMTTDSRIKIAVQKSGRLTEHSLELLVRCGLSYSRGKDQLICYGENMPVDVLLVRDDDIPRLVQEDICDLGIVGLNIIEERRLELLDQGETELFTEIGRLDFGQCRLSFGLPAGVEYGGAEVAARQAHRDDLSAHSRATT